MVSLAEEADTRRELEPLERSLADSNVEKQDPFRKKLNEAERRWLGESIAAGPVVESSERHSPARPR